MQGLTLSHQLSGEGDVSSPQQPPPGSMVTQQYMGPFVRPVSMMPPPPPVSSQAAPPASQPHQQAQTQVSQL